MTTFLLTSPDGVQHRVEGPDGATEDQAMQILQQQLGNGGSADQGPGVMSRIGREAGLAARAGIEGVTALPQVITNAGIGAYNLGALGVNSVAGTNIPTMQSSTESLENTMTRMGLPEPESGSEKLANVGMQMITGGAAEKATKPLESLLGHAVPPASPGAQRAVAQGYKIPPSQLRPQNPAVRFAEGISGKDQMAGAMTLKNQEVTNNLAKQELGLPVDRPITRDAIDDVIDKAGSAYEHVKQLPTRLNATYGYRTGLSQLGAQARALAREFPNTSSSRDIDSLVQDLNKNQLDPALAVEKIKELRFDASANFANRADPSKLRLAQAQQQAADLLDKLVEDNLRVNGRGRLFQDYIAARTKIAKAYAVRNALDSASGNVSAPDLYAAVDKGKPMTGKLGDIAQFAGQYPKVAREAQKIGSQPGWSPWDFVFGPFSVAARPGIREAAMTQPVQNWLANGIPPETLAAILGTNAPLVNVPLQQQGGQ